MDDDDGFELNLVFTKPTPKPVVSQTTSTTTTNTNNKNNNSNNNRNNEQKKVNNGIINKRENNQSDKSQLKPWERNKVPKKEDEKPKHIRYLKNQDSIPSIPLENGNGNDKNDSKVEPVVDKPKVINIQTLKQKYKSAESKTKRDEQNRPILPNLEPKMEKVEESQIFSNANFGSLKLSETLTRNLQGHMKLEKPTNIQEAAIPSILRGEDALVRAETGSGKTLCYLIPIVQKLTEQRVSRTDGCYSVIISPTRELALQIFDELQKLLKPFYWIIPGLIMGGEKRTSEKARLRKGINILVSTPGRLLDHLQNTQSFPVEKIKWLVLDEADRLLDLGFEKDITTIISLFNQKKTFTNENIMQSSGKRQNILVSATLNQGISRLATISLNNPTYIGLDAEVVLNPLSNENLEKFSAPKQLDQYFVEIELKEKLVSLIAFLKWKTNLNIQENQGKPSKIIVFFSSCDSVDFHHHLFTNLKLKSNINNGPHKKGQHSGINKKKEKKQIDLKKLQKQEKKSGDDGSGSSDDENDSDSSSEDEDEEEQDPNAKKALFGDIPIYRLHGDIEQQHRTKTFFDFKASKNGILLTTDVAARGLDLPQVNWIVQYDPCSDTKDYVHRIGRTARIGNTGCALLFLLPSEREYIGYLERLDIHPLEMKGTSILQSLFYTSEGQLRKFTKSSQLESQVHDLQILCERYLLEDSKCKDLARSAYQSSIRAYSTHKSELKKVFHVSHLHLGHMSKSFALRETPTELNKMSQGVKGAKKVEKGDEFTILKQTPEFKMKNYKSTNEFSDGVLELSTKAIKDNFRNQNEMHNIFKTHVYKKRPLDDNNTTDTQSTNGSEPKKFKSI
ncbi:putative RNA helicase [Tieghemostelium lacteum]|uniref:ATP-dependent RNA helicase n=1 Tax=Tieghemostelium lacteum TaxID=361077 RepID=A0A151ZEP3_TIELA|nr:putative RNA helicase [Tieghemostelium lacteum]|eukprot:KYQ92426.1 putative RNA helicase [Tieghemostelium lacteum]